MSTCFIDVETRCAVPIQRGTDLYSRSAQCMIVTWALNEEPVQIWEVDSKYLMPAALRRILDDPTITLVAHNAVFDRRIIRDSLDAHTDIKRWRCTRAAAYSHGLPGSLELLGLVIGLPEEHRKLAADSKRLINLFCVPRDDGKYGDKHSHPADWKAFCEYAMRDTDALREIYRKLPSHNFSGENLAFWHLNQRTNERGFQFDAKFAEAAVQFLTKAKEITDATMRDATDGAVTAATQRNRLLDYLARKCGLDLPNLRAAEVREWLEHDDISPEVRLLLETRLEAGKSSGAKYRRGLTIRGPGDRVRDSIQCNGAGRTGRNSHKGFQPGNMARPQLTVRRADGKMEQIPVKAKYIDEVVMPGIYSGAALKNDLVYGGPNEAAAIALRHVITAAPGNDLTVGDWSNIESRVLAWMADETWKLAAYEAIDRGEGVDLYKLLFSQFFGTDVKDVNDNGRQTGKVSDLAFGFGGGVGALVTMAAGYQLDLDPLADLVLPRAEPAMLKKAEKAWRRAFLTGEDYELEPRVYQACDILKQTYREANSAINHLRHEVDIATKTAIKEPGRSFTVGKCRIWSTSSWLIIQLPSGRRLLYANPRVEVERITDPENPTKVMTYEYITYATARGMTWRRERAWSGLFIENMVQAIANDILRAGLLRVDAAAWKIPAACDYLMTLPEDARTALVLDVHDEVVLDLPQGCVTLKWLLELLVEACWWSTGLPLAAAGWQGFRYGKR